MAAINSAWQAVPPRARQISITVIVLFLIYTAVGFWGLPALITSYLPGKLGPVLHRTVTIGAAAFNPYTLDMKIENISITEPDGTPFASVDSIFYDMCWVSLVKFMPVVKEFQIISPQCYISRSSEGVFNFSNLTAEKGGEKKSEPEESKKFPRFLVEQLIMSKGRVTVVDQYVNPDFQTTVAPVDLTVGNLTFLPENETVCQLSLETESGEIVSSSASLELADMKAGGRLTLDQVLLKKYLPYYGGLAGIDVTSGTLGVQSVFQFDASGAEPTGGVSNIQVSVKDLAFTGPLNKQQSVSVPSLNLTCGGLDLASRMAEVDQVLVESFDFRDPTEGDLQASLATLTVNKAAVELKSLKAAVGTISIDKLTAALENSQGKHLASLSRLTIQNTTADAKARLAEIGQTGLEGLTVTMENPEEKLLAALSRLTIKKATADADAQEAGIEEIEIRAVKLDRGKPEEPLVDIPELDLRTIRVNAKDRTAKVNEIKTGKGVIHCKRTDKGAVNLLQPMALFAKAHPVEENKVQPSESMGESSPWTVALDTFDLKDYAVDIEDHFSETTVATKLQAIEVTLDNFSTAPGHQFDVSLAMGIAKHGRFETSGKMTVEPLTADLEVKTSDVAIQPFHPYWNQHVGVLLTRGSLNSQGHVTAAMDPKSGPDVNFKGDVSVIKMDTIDIFKGEDLVKWDNLSLAGMDVGLNPTHVTVKEIALTDYYARLAIGDDGRLSVMNVLRKQAAEVGETIDDQTSPVETGADAPLPQVIIDKVTLQGGQVNFADRFVKPNYKAEFYNLGGSISGLNSAEGTRADVLLEGNLENHAPLEIKGRVNPLAPTRFVDVVLSFKDITLGPFTPYSGKYIGRKIKKGKLHVDLAYTLEGQKLKAENRLFIDDLILGEKVDSPDAVNMPVELAMSLLKDRNGDINLNIPVQGDLDDPEFSLAGTIGMVIKNLITKIITAPFSILGAVLGSGAELSSVDFEPGQSDLSPPSIEILDTLGDALVERPGLKLEAEGTVDMESDSRELRKQGLEKLLDAQRQLILASQPATPSAPLTPAETQTASTAPAATQASEAATASASSTAQPSVADKEDAANIDPVLTAAYLAADFPKPKDAAGNIKILPAEEMEKLLLTSIKVTDSDLRHLALARAETVRDYLVNTKKIETDRVFVLESGAGESDPAASTDAQEKQSAKGQVLFKLK